MVVKDSSRVFGVEKMVNTIQYTAHRDTSKKVQRRILDVLFRIMCVEVPWKRDRGLNFPNSTRRQRREFGEIVALQRSANNNCLQLCFGNILDLSRMKQDQNILLMHSLSSLSVSDGMWESSKRHLVAVELMKVHAWRGRCRKAR